MQLPGDEKLDSLQLEVLQYNSMTELTVSITQYTYLLTSQLESQRHYFEGKVTQIETEAQEQVYCYTNATIYMYYERYIRVFGLTVILDCLVHCILK